MKIGIDARFLTHPQRGGFKTYSENLITALAEVDQNNEYILYLDRTPDISTKLPSQPNFSYCIITSPLPFISMPWREQIGLARQARQDNLDILHSPCLTAPLSLTCASIVTLHDMIWYYPKKLYGGKTKTSKRKLMDWYYRFVPQLAASRAAIVITVSYAARESILSCLGLSPERVVVTYEAAKQIYRRIENEESSRAIRRKYSLQSDFILALGSADSRKNLTTLVAAFALLPEKLRENYALAIVGNFNSPELMKQIEELGIASRVVFLENVSDEDLVLLYNSASLFTFPSLYEGFGLPLLEAMACGTPIVAANNSSIPEVVGDAALLVEAKDIEGMAVLMTRALTDKVLRAELIQKGLARATSFSWEECARQTICAYQQGLTNKDRVVEKWKGLEPARLPKELGHTDK